MALVDGLLPVLDKVRGIPAALGLRPYTVSIFKRTWSGSRVGVGTATDTVTGELVSLGTYNPRVRAVTTREIIASAQLYAEQDLRIGPITPPYAGSSADHNAFSDFDPTPVASPVQLWFKITGPGYPAGGAWFRKVSQDTTDVFAYWFVVRKTGEIP